MDITLETTGTNTETHHYTEDWNTIQNTHGLIVQVQNKYDNRTAAPNNKIVTCMDKNGVPIGPPGTRPF